MPIVSFDDTNYRVHVIENHTQRSSSGTPAYRCGHDKPNNLSHMLVVQLMRNRWNKQCSLCYNVIWWMDNLYKPRHPSSQHVTHWRSISSGHRCVPYCTWYFNWAHTVPVHQSINLRSGNPQDPLLITFSSCDVHPIRKVLWETRQKVFFAFPRCKTLFQENASSKQKQARTSSNLFVRHISIVYYKNI